MIDLVKTNKKYFIIIGSILACFTAFINKYPLIYPDTGSYIYSGFNGLVFDDRPIFYGLFLRHISLASSLWYVIFVQGFLVSYLLYLTLGIFVKEDDKKNYLFLCIITFLTLFTGFSYTVSILIPDIFTSIAILCLINLLLNKGLTKVQNLFVGILFVFSICTQFSSLGTFTVFFLIIVVYSIIQGLRKKVAIFNFKKLILTLGLFSFSFILIPTINYAFAKKFRISGSNHVFVMNHLLEIGVLENYLNDECKNKNYTICEFKDSLGWNFIWSEDSPLQKTGGWKSNEKEYNQIINEIIFTPKYQIIIAQKAIEYTFKQFFSFEISVPPPQLHASPPFGQISWRYKDNVRESLSSLQSAEKWNLGNINFLHTIIIVCSAVFLFLIVFKAIKNSILPELRLTILLVFIHNIINAAVCSNLSTIDSRFQNRIVWLLPALAIIVLFKIIDERRSPVIEN